LFIEFSVELDQSYISEYSIKLLHYIMSDRSVLWLLQFVNKALSTVSQLNIPL
jgi:hypothetical protein